MDASPLIVVHGANGAAAEMRPLIAHLAGRRPVVAFDLLGHGGRPVPDTLTPAAMIDDLLRQCDAAGIGAAHWFGFSVGGLIALRIAADHPERVLSLSALTAKTVYDEASVAHAAHLTDVARIRRAGVERGAMLARIHAPQDWMQVIGRARAMFLSFAETPPFTPAHAARIRAPVLLMGGTADPLVPAAEVRALAARLPRALAMLFDGSAHPLPDAPLAAIAQAILTFADDPERAVRAARVKLGEFRWDRMPLT